MFRQNNNCWTAAALFGNYAQIKLNQSFFRTYLPMILKIIHSNIFFRKVKIMSCVVNMFTLILESSYMHFQTFIIVVLTTTFSRFFYHFQISIPTSEGRVTPTYSGNSNAIAEQNQSTSSKMSKAQRSIRQWCS